jgi:F0F1-type ATP synthase delta subunit
LFLFLDDLIAKEHQEWKKWKEKHKKSNMKIKDHPLFSMVMLTPFHAETQKNDWFQSNIRNYICRTDPLQNFDFVLH